MNEANIKFLKAAENGDIDQVKVSLAWDVDINSKDQEGWTALMWAAARNHPQIITLLLECNADINALDYEGMTALMWASFKGCVENAKILLDHGADLSIKDDEGKSALQWATDRGCVEVVSVINSFVENNALMINIHENKSLIGELTF